jgi:hypothetical protein
MLSARMVWNIPWGLFALPCSFQKKLWDCFNGALLLHSFGVAGAGWAIYLAQLITMLRTRKNSRFWIHFIVFIVLLIVNCAGLAVMAEDAKNSR